MAAAPPATQAPSMLYREVSETIPASATERIAMFITPYFLILAKRARGSNFLGSLALSDLSEAVVALRTSAILSDSLAMSNAASMYASDFLETSRPETSLT